jgi:hypothetical protein
VSTYRLSRNVEKSFIDFISSEIQTAGWSGIRYEKSFSDAYDGTLPCIVVNSSDRPITRREVGTDETTKEINIEIRIFATDDGMRLDIADFLIEELLKGIEYYEYTIAQGDVVTKTEKGRIQITKVLDNRKDLSNVTGLEKADKFRHLIRLQCRVSLI